MASRKCKECGKSHHLVVQDTKTQEVLYEYDICESCLMSKCIYVPITEQVTLTEQK